MQELNHTSPVDFEALFNDKVLAPNAVYQLMGNGMHRMQVGQLLLYIMANVAFRDSVFGLDLDAVLHYLNLIVCFCASDVCCLSQIIFVVLAPHCFVIVSGCEPCDDADDPRHHRRG